MKEKDLEISIPLFSQTLRVQQTKDAFYVKICDKSEVC